VRLEFDREDDTQDRVRPSRDLTIAERHLDALESELEAYFAGNLKMFSVPVAPSGSEFERRAWAFLRSIPFGQTRSYGAQARAIAGPNAARAVGRANGANPIAIVIPCHRVIGADGSLIGYASGIERKRWLLEHERNGQGAAEPWLFPV
jgi:methylated-DNA-[protein]-cysteine S-methyltransferase